jgi:hypothetical protein
LPNQWPVEMLNENRVAPGFIPSDVMNHQALEPGQKVIFSVRRVKDQAFHENVVVMRDKQFRGLESA